MKDTITYPLSDFVETATCPRCGRELPFEDIDLFTDLCWNCVAEVEDDTQEAARWNLEQMESAKAGGWEVS